jgi:hypothetical protein
MRTNYLQPHAYQLVRPPHPSAAENRDQRPERRLGARLPHLLLPLTVMLSVDVTLSLTLSVILVAVA